MPNKPPQTLDSDLELTPEDWDPKQVYYLHAALIVPRPIAWVGTCSADGADNLAPHSYFNGIADDPPYVMFAIEGESNTYLNLRDVPEFTVSMVSVDQAQVMEATASAIPHGESEFAWAGLETVPSRTVRPKRIATSKATMECVAEKILPVGKRNQMVIGRVKHYHVSREIWRDGRVDPMLMRPLCRLGGRYAEIGNLFKMVRPDWDSVSEAGLGQAADLVPIIPDAPKTEGGTE